ncbi:MAG: acyl-CoA dehydrogenase family protein [Porticoccaceae bacterium]
MNFKDSREALTHIERLSTTFAKTYPQRDRDNQYPAEEMDQLKASGLLGFSIPKSYGGLGASCADITQAIVLLAQGNPAIGQMFLVHCLLGASFLDELAPEALKRAVYDDILTNQRFLGNAASEKSNDPKKGYDLTLAPVDGGVHISGRKFFSTGSLAADLVAVIGMMDGNMALAIVRRDAPGLQIVDDWDAMGQRGTGSGTTLFDKVFAPSAMLIPTLVGADRQMAQTNLLGPITQIGFTAIFIGAAKGALREATHYVRTTTRAYPWPGLSFECAVDDPHILAQIGVAPGGSGSPDPRGCPQGRCGARRARGGGYGATARGGIGGVGGGVPDQDRRDPHRVASLSGRVRRLWRARGCGNRIWIASGAM